MTGRAVVSCGPRNRSGCGRNANSECRWRQGDHRARSEIVPEEITTSFAAPARPLTSSRCGRAVVKELRSENRVPNAISARTATAARSTARSRAAAATDARARFPPKMTPGRRMPFFAWLSDAIGQFHDGERRASRGTSQTETSTRTALDSAPAAHPRQARFRDKVADRYAARPVPDADVYARKPEITRRHLSPGAAVVKFGF